MSTSKQEQKQLIRKRLKSYFEDFDFVFQGYAAERDAFTLKKKWGVTEVCLDYKTSGNHYFSKVYISHFEVEQIIVELGLPNHDFSARIKSEDYSLTSVLDSQIVLNFKEYPVKTIDQAEVLSQSIIEYMNKQGWAFAERFSYLSNVLTEMNRLEAEGRLWRDILSGQADYFFRGLIISKLCKDPKFLSKVRYVDTIFFDHQYSLQEWLPYYERLKDRLTKLDS